MAGCCLRFVTPMNAKAPQELVIILVTSAGFGIVLYALPENLTFAQRVFFLAVLLVVSGSLYKLLSPTQHNTDTCDLHATPPAHSNHEQSAVQTQQQPLPYSQGADEATMRR